MRKKITVKTKTLGSNYQVEIASGALENVGNWANGVLGGSRKMVTVSNKKVFGLHGERMHKGLENSGNRTGLHLIGDGERFKNMKTLETALNAFSNFGISRGD